MSGSQAHPVRPQVRPAAGMSDSRRQDEPLVSARASAGGTVAPARYRHVDDDLGQRCGEPVRHVGIRESRQGSSASIRDRERAPGVPVGRSLAQRGQSEDRDPDVPSPAPECLVTDASKIDVDLDPGLQGIGPGHADVLNGGTAPLGVSEACRGPCRCGPGRMHRFASSGRAGRGAPDCPSTRGALDRR
jgi:hypothetical protein